MAIFTCNILISCIEKCGLLSRWNKYIQIRVLCTRITLYLLYTKQIVIIFFFCTILRLFYIFKQYILMDIYTAFNYYNYIGI